MEFPQVKDAIKLIVAVEDDAGNGSEIPITVIISDENDNPPEFSQVNLIHLQLQSNDSLLHFSNKVG